MMVCNALGLVGVARWTEEARAPFVVAIGATEASGPQRDGSVVITVSG